MREALFIKRNKDRWQQIATSHAQHPDDTANEFIQLVEDLGYSKTFYPHSTITQFLNNEASKKYLGIYQNQPESSSRVTHFFKYTLPLTIGRHHRTLLVCFCLFVLFVAIGFFSAAGDQTFVRQVLGDRYVNMTENNIRKGTPFGVYGFGNELLSFGYIFINNLVVSLKEFAGGILLGIPTIYGLLTNSISVGAFEYLFYSHNLTGASLLTILIHGTLELSTFVISAASGIVLAKSWWFPGTLPRIDALKQGAKEGLIIAMSNFPMLFAAAFFEGFITRHAGMPVWIKLLIIGFSLVVVIGYFIVYPIRLRQKAKITRGTVI